MTQYKQFANADSVLEALYQAIITDLQQAIATQGHATLAVSGGRSPIPLFIRLSQADLDWSKVYITLVDDRWVDCDHEASNENLVMTYLLQNQAKAAQFVGLKNSAATPFAGAKAASEALQSKLPLPFDVLILGMGEDGHTASLFPHADNLSQGLDMNSGELLVGMKPGMEPFIDRITLTLPAILSSRQIYLPVTGHKKVAVLQQARAAEDTNQMPIRAVLQQTVTKVEVFFAE